MLLAAHAFGEKMTVWNKCIRIGITIKNCHLGSYRNGPKFSERYAWANSADPDQTAPRGAV